MIRRLRYLAGSLKLRLALASFVLIAASVALTVVLVLRAMEQRSQRAVLDAEVANAERIGLVVSAKIVSLQKAMRAATADLPTGDIDRAAAVAAYLERHKVLRSLFDSVFVVGPDLHLAAPGRIGAAGRGVSVRRRRGSGRPGARPDTLPGTASPERGMHWY